MASFATIQKEGFTVISNSLLRYYPTLKLSEIEAMLLLQLEAFKQANNFFPSDNELSERMNLSPVEISQIIQDLIDKEIIELGQKRDKEGRITNFYDLNLLYQKLDKIIDENDANNDDQFNLTSDVEEKRKVNPLQELVRQFEIEFGRLLSPIEKQEIAAWLNIDHYNPEIVKLALREAILAQVYNFKYVDRILLNWQRHGLNTPDQIKNFLQRN
ncbi:DNA replication protein DnaD [Lactobacillus taiwanensis DSM 21401]|jgi:DnaD and phage-associated domain|uniref:DNA replication protein DnaD n=1 Tax=Lactobacillus taiwanensis TaxID=508451 RepID=A0A256LGP7_9LACO|nr:DnaD domain protein [Lactobacillus taiwanensis]KRM97904.1 DNA replication protein DnaD [Lactobacillus taiwanensis DSM 21401]MCR1902981.1 DnaD domain protein [Lactobacillus taiwanensis]MCR1916099.1 DnaD domain protein [Lactobacillus taiwanensis]OYR88695.1 DNA replication protein DnaD [Lactobacillus taiwanensis]OYR92584.1 DNA replication protein DnaD [Lactobacillus taiwanensis]